MATIKTHEGLWLDVLDPDPTQIGIADIAHSLSLTARFNGHTDELYSVAQHSVNVSWDVPTEDALWGLMHDAAEAYIGDLASPIKQAFPEFQAMEDWLLEVIGRRFGLAWPVPLSVWEADKRAVEREMYYLMGIQGCFRPFEDLSYGVGIEIAWPPLAAEAMFLRRFNELMDG